MVVEFTLPTVNAVTDLGKKRGAAGSHRFLCDDENDYIVKFAVPQNKMAINELVAGSLAIELGLTTPKKIFVNISREVIEDSGDLANVRIDMNPHIGSKVLINECDDFDKFSDDKLNAMKLINADVLYGVVVFDNWVYNKDRCNRGNNMIAFLPRNKIRFEMIDYSHCLTKENWSGETLQSLKNDETLMPNFPFIENNLNDNSKFNEWIDKVEQFDDELIEAIINTIPNSWNFAEDEKTILLDFLKTRKNIVRRIISEKYGV